MTPTDELEAEIALTAFLLTAHPDADVEAVLRHFAEQVQAIQQSHSEGR